MSEFPNGLYIFFAADGKSPKYVGKSSSRSFIERIPSHFDQRLEAWLNTLPKRIIAREGFHKYDEALKEALTYHLVLVA